MRILVSGSSGLIGSALVERLSRRHDEPAATRHEVLRLVRRLLAAGFSFRDAELGAALSRLLL